MKNIYEPCSVKVGLHAFVKKSLQPVSVSLNSSLSLHFLHVKGLFYQRIQLVF